MSVRGALRPGAWAAVAGWLCLNALLSHQSTVPGASRVPDVVLHAVEFGILAVLLLRALSGRLRGPHRPAVLAGIVLFGVAWGITDEVHQSFVPGRDASVKDALVDTAATAAVVLAAWRASRRGSARSVAPGRRRTNGVAGGREALDAPPGSPETGDPPRAPGFPRVELLTREGCHLCEEAWSVLETVLGEEGGRWRHVPIDDRPELLSRYALEVPVVRIDGIKRFRGRVDAGRLRVLVEEPGRFRGGAGARLD